MTKALKIKACKACGEDYQPWNSLQRACSPRCALDFNAERDRQAKIKAFNRETRERKKSLLTLTDYANLAQSAVNSYINVRDTGKPCVSCGTTLRPGRGRHASHYRAVGAAKQLRFNTWNIHSSCYSCNVEKSGNLLEYRIRLIKRIGQHRVDELECDQRLAKYDIDYLKRIRKVFNRRTKHLKRLRGQE